VRGRRVGPPPVVVPEPGRLPFEVPPPVVQRGVRSAVEGGVGVRGGEVGRVGVPRLPVTDPAVTPASGRGVVLRSPVGVDGGRAVLAPVWQPDAFVDVAPFLGETGSARSLVRHAARGVPSLLPLVPAGPLVGELVRVLRLVRADVASVFKVRPGGRRI
ncbi:hypothetical protein THAOC_36957, partial [Thalassiosira oceanica]